MSESITLPLLFAAAIAALAVVIVAFLILRDPETAKRRVEALFRRAPKPSRPPDEDHYYRPYWS